MKNDNEEYKSIKEVADEWGITVRRVQMLCNSGKLAGAKKTGRTWLIPKNAERPADNRIVTGRFISTNKPEKKKTSSETDLRLLLKVAHDIRSMLNSVLGYSDLIQKNAKDAQRVTEYAKNIELSGRSTLRLTTNVMECIRMSEKRLVVDAATFSLESIPKDVLRFNYEDIKRKKLNINQQIDIRHEIIMADKNKVGLSLSNLFDNAVKHSVEGQNIDFTIEELDEIEPGMIMYRYTIEDYGAGIDEATLSKIENYSGDYIKGEGNITGLGIPVAKGLIELMGGSVTFESRLHTGTKVTVLLPHQISDFSLDAGCKNIVSEKYIGKRLLLADDNELNREIAYEVLTEAGFNVECAEDGIICVAMLERSPDDYYDCILMDIQMPNLDGITATKIIRGLKDKKKAGIPIIAITANVVRDERNKALTVGMNGFLEKPLKVEQLLAIMERVFG